MFDIALTALQCLDFGVIGIKSDNRVAHFGITQYQRQSDIPQPDYADHSFPGYEAGYQTFNCLIQDFYS